MDILKFLICKTNILSRFIKDLPNKLNTLSKTKHLCLSWLLTPLLLFHDFFEIMCKWIQVKYIEIFFFINNNSTMKEEARLTKCAVSILVIIAAWAILLLPLVCFSSSSSFSLVIFYWLFPPQSRSGFSLFTMKYHFLWVSLPQRWFILSKITLFHILLLLLLPRLFLIGSNWLKLVLTILRRYFVQSTFATLVNQRWGCFWDVSTLVLNIIEVVIQ